MSYKYSRGSQVIGDLKAADDTQRDTKIDFGEDYIGLETSGSVRMVISGSDGKVGIGVTSPSYKLDVNGDIRVRGNDIRDNSGNKAITFDGSANTSIVNDLTIGGNTFDANNKSIIKHIDHGAFSNADSNNNEAFVPDDYIHDYGGSNLFVTFVPPFSGSIDKLVVRGVNNTDLSDLGNITATVKIGNQGTNSYNIDTNPDSFESVTINSADLGAETNAAFIFSSSNFTPQDVYCVSLKPTNNWDTNGTKYINFTIVSSYLID